MLSSSNFLRRLASATLFNVIYLLAQSILFIGLTPWVLNVLGKHIFGLWTLLLAVMSFASIASFRIISTTMKYSAELTGLDSSIKKFNEVTTFCYFFMTLIGSLSALLLWTLSDRISVGLNATVHDSSIFSGAIELVAIGLVPLFISEVSIGILFGMVYNKLCGGLVTLHHIFLWAGALFVGLWGGDLYHLGLLILLVNLSRCITTTFASFWVRRSIGFHFAFSASVVREVLSYTLLAWFGSLGLLIFNSLDRIIIGIVLGPSIAGVYGIAASLSLRLSILADQFTQVLVPFASNRISLGKFAEVRIIFGEITRLTSSTISILTILLVLWMDMILSIWISPQFSRIHTQFFSILVVAYTLATTFRPAHQLLLGIGWLKFPSTIIFSSAITMVSVVWFLAQNFDLTGAAIGNFVFVFVVSINFYLARRIGYKLLDTLADIGWPMVIVLLTALLNTLYFSIIIRILVTFALITMEILILKIKPFNYLGKITKPLESKADEVYVFRGV
jgi:O-antigen/teichoic acid export membrane protein